ncbi:MAG: glycosyltransferase [Dehalococcoidia bacterium]|nr:glycosyltransferase [Dehalococcoidia bacterium]
MKAVLHVATLNKAIGLETGYGPIETVIHGLDKGLHNLGYRSIVACSADAIVNGEKHETVAESLGAYCSANTEAAQERIGRHLASSLARSRSGDIGVVHMHEWYEHIYSGSFNPSVPIVMTLHVPGSDSGMVDFHDRHPATPLASRSSVHWVAISEYQRRQYAGLIPIAHTIPHGIDVDRYEFGAVPAPTPYLFSIGRITHVKGQDTAIEIAKRSGTKLILAGCVQNKAEDRAFFEQLRPSIDFTVDLSDVPVDASYYDRVMKPILSSDKQIVYVGELNDASKKYWYRHALATVFPIRWGEPFGMVLIESMASGPRCWHSARVLCPRSSSMGRRGSSWTPSMRWFARSVTPGTSTAAPPGSTWSAISRSTSWLAGTRPCMKRSSVGIAWVSLAASGRGPGRRTASVNRC